MLTQLFSEKTLLVLVTLLGMAMCSMGIGQVAARGAWQSPLALVAYLMGALVLVVAGATLFNIRLPLIDSDRTALIVVILLAVAKVGLSQLHRMIA